MDIDDNRCVVTGSAVSLHELHALSMGYSDMVPMPNLLWKKKLGAQVLCSAYVASPGEEEQGGLWGDIGVHLKLFVRLVLTLTNCYYLRGVDYILCFIATCYPMPHHRHH